MAAARRLPFRTEALDSRAVVYLDSASFVFIITRSVSEGPSYDQSLADASGYENAVSTSKVALSNYLAGQHIQRLLRASIRLA